MLRKLSGLTLLLLLVSACDNSPKPKWEVSCKVDGHTIKYTVAGPEQFSINAHGTIIWDRNRHRIAEYSPLVECNAVKLNASSSTN